MPDPLEPQPHPDSPTLYDPENPGGVSSEVATNGDTAVERAAEPPSPPPPPATTPEEPADPDEDGMVRMSFLEHLEELRSRLLKALLGIGVAFASAIGFSSYLWEAVREPFVLAQKQLGMDPNLAQITPTEAFSIIWVKLPILAAIFIASPWVIYQAWSFIAPGLYKRERRMAVPFILTCAGLFILGGSFAYFVAFRFGLVFLLGIGQAAGVKAMISITEYFDLFVNVILGVAIVFELPVLIFFLTLLRVVSPRFLLSHSRYAILLIVLAAAIITPTPDVYNLMIFAVPMVLLYFVGVFASYLLVLSREGKKFPWRVVLFIAVVLGTTLWFGAYMLQSEYGFKFVPRWPFLVR